MPEAANKKEAREIIHIQVGKAGIGIGHEFWRDLCEEHKISYRPDMPLDKGKFMGGPEDDIYSDHLDVFFNEGAGGRWVPRCILLDLNMQDLAQVTGTPLGELYRPENVLGNDDGSANCYAKAFHTEGPDLADHCLENVRKEVERCNCLQGVQFTNSVSGGTGSGLTGLLLKTLHDYLDKGSKCIMQTFTLVPAPGVSDVLIEPYNAALGLQDLLEHCHQCFLYDNRALTDICQKTLEKDTPKMLDMNNIIARCMSGITSCLRFPGPLSSSLHKMQTNLVPFKNAHFLISSFAPLTAASSGKYRRTTVLDLAQQLISKDNVTVKCDPLNPGDPREGILKARFLASNASWRGGFATKEVDQVTHDMQRKGSRFDPFFPDWIPNSIASNICRIPHAEAGESAVLVSNNTAVHEIFDRIAASWESMFKVKSYLHVFEQDGISVQDMMESRGILQYVSEEYCDFARWEDKFFVENMAKAVINDRAIMNDEQQRIAEELQALGEGGMFIEHVKGTGGKGR
eukprot:gnl/TRDRNA2_/TRDRNA2_184622_c0_seq1.p1 gnl/TRDRNA2_/TRDRNA2_184622_c0~~gnl/TRDRNA2_/TRDRNA2_184622_c0_seq1.p1  ORF type:complete len:539 (+),score=91.43 gnl/TRDRNA2_/TRDRNA2_184622_c0_seq1:75-1619(+)